MLTVVAPHGSAAHNWQALVSRLDAPLPPAAEATARSLGSPLGSSTWPIPALMLPLLTAAVVESLLARKPRVSAR